MSIDLTKLTPAPWCVGGKIYPNGREATEDDYVFVNLARQDLDVKQRRGWHTEKRGLSDWWCVPQLEGILVERGEENVDAAFQRGHDVGLLTKADAWFREHIEKGEVNDA